MDVVNIISNDNNNLSSDTIEFVQNLQIQVDKKLSSMAKTKMYSSKLDLGCEIDTSDFERLVDYKHILDGILSCNSCYQDICLDDVIGLVKNEISKN